RRRPRQPQASGRRGLHPTTRECGGPHPQWRVPLGAPGGPPSFPRPLLAAAGVAPAATTRAEQFDVLAYFLLGLGASALELPRFPKLKFFAQTDKSDLGRDARMGAKALRKHDTSVLVDREDLGDT